jgi:hypothetical protein
MQFGLTNGYIMLPFNNSGTKTILHRGTTMSRESRSLAAMLSTWKVMVAGFGKHSDDMAFAKSEAAKLADLATKAEQCNVNQEQLKADLAKMTETLEKTVTEGKKMYATLLRYAKGKYGPGSKELKDFQATGENRVAATRKKTATA